MAATKVYKHIPVKIEVFKKANEFKSKLYSAKDIDDWDSVMLFMVEAAIEKLSKEEKELNLLTA